MPKTHMCILSVHSNEGEFRSREHPKEQAAEGTAFHFCIAEVLTFWMLALFSLDRA